MLHRVLFVAGMTVGVVAPIVWGAYTSRQPVTVTVQRVAAREPAQPPRATAAAPTATVSPPVSHAQKAPRVPPAPSHAPPTGLPAVSHAPPLPAPAPIKLAMSSPLATTSQAPHAEAPAPAAPTRPAAPISEKRASKALARAPLPKARPHSGTPHVKLPHEHDGAPAVVSRYVGPHIIVVCAELTARERRHAGCP
jgi:hypothetical protein